MSRSEEQKLLKQATNRIKILQAKLRQSQEAIAIIGLACRFPGANDSDQYWQLLKDGKDGIREVPASRWDIGDYYDPDPDAPGKMNTRWGGFIEGIDQFDASAFGIAPREAVRMDPQHRLLLETSWHALENAGISPLELAGSNTGVFIGISTQDYAQLQVQLGQEQIDAYLGTGTAHSAGVGRISFQWGLQGPNMALETACSSSLVAVHQARRALLNGETDLVIVGGVNALLAPEASINFSKARMLAADGRCKTFDAAADGYVRGEGCGIILCKRLSDAQRDGDRILAVMRGSAVNQDGASASLTVPNGLAQQQVIQAALDQAHIDPKDVVYLEAHGTGTKLGDPIEVQAAAQVFGQGRDQDQPLLMGAVKSNIGHLEAAAGIAGIIKTVLALQHQQIPAQCHYQTPNPHIPWQTLPVKVVDTVTSWPNAQGIAGVSSFGFSGTNAHVLLEAAPEMVDSDQANGLKCRYHILPLAANNIKALHDLAARYCDWFAVNPQATMSDIAYTAAISRSHHRHRAALVVATLNQANDLCIQLKSDQSDPNLLVGEATKPLKIAFLFTGQGSQYSGMAQRLYHEQPLFKTTLDHCANVLDAYLEVPFLAVLFGQIDEHTGQPLLDQTRYTQPALFALEMALYRLWQSFGIEAHRLLGHSVGEYAAACAAGVFSLEDGLQLMAQRGALMDQISTEGSMLAIFKPVKAVRAMLTDSLSLAADNGAHCVVSGTCQAIEMLKDRCQQDGVRYHQLKSQQAFHSALIEPMLDEFEAAASRIAMHPPEITLISNLTGHPVAPDQINASYWCRHARESVNFAEGVNSLANSGCNIVLEIGPQPVLSRIVSQVWPQQTPPVAVASLRKNTDDMQLLCQSLAKLYSMGVNPDWRAWHAPWPKRKLALPLYPFQRQSYWIPKTSLSPANKPSITELTYHTHWQPALLSKQRFEAGVWIVMGSRLTSLEAAFEARGHRLLHLTMSDLDQLEHLVATTPLSGVLWFADNHDTDQWQMISRLLNELLGLTQALITRGHALPYGLTLITTAAVAIEANDHVNPLQSSLWGMGRTIQIEQPTLGCRLIDINSSQDQDSALVDLLLAPSEPQLALRNQQILVPRLQQSEGDSPGKLQLKADASYLVTGGLGALGFETARWLAQAGAKHLVLVGRRSATAEIAQQIAALQTAEDCTITTAALDISQIDAVNALIARFGDDWPDLKGIIHAAGVLDDGILVNQNQEKFTTVLQPKVLGALCLHNVTQQIPLDFFVLYSSSAAVFGSPGQSNYAAANAYLDGLAQSRQAQGLVATSIQWGPWASGMAAKRTIFTKLVQQGLLPLETHIAHQAFNQVLQAGTVAQMVIDINWQRFSQKFEQQPPLLVNYLHASTQVKPNQWSQQLQTLPQNQRNPWLMKQLQQQVQQILGLAELPAVDSGFFELGMDSLMAVELRNHLQAEFTPINLSATLTFDYVNIVALTDYLLGLSAENSADIKVSQANSPVVDEQEDIAIIGLANRFPGGQDSEQYWQLLAAGADSIGEVPASRWDIAHYYDPDPDAPGKMNTRWGGFIDDIDQFDASAFGIAPREAVRMDPQHRLLLETSWHALEDAGIASSRLAGTNTGVFIGISTQDYAQLQVELGQAQIDAYLGTGSAHSAGVGRISFQWGLQGPNMAIDTACSSSLVAVHLARRALLNRETDLVITGGVNALLTPEVSINCSKAHMLAADGHCKTFDAAADGYVRSEGCGIVICKRLRDAQRDGDRILAVMRGSAVNQDGASSGLTVPNGLAQQQVIQTALDQAQIDAKDVVYLEAHGTGTKLGDPIEVQAAARVLGQGRDRHQPLLMGAVKNNIGHLEAAAGIAGLIKTVLALQQQQIPPQCDYQSPNPHIPWQTLPVKVVDKPTAWPDRPRIAGVSSFGFSGTNAHVLLTAAPETITQQTTDTERHYHVLPLSANTDQALQDLIRGYGEWFSDNPQAMLADVVYTAALGRNHYSQRVALVVETIDQAHHLCHALQLNQAASGLYSSQGNTSHTLALLFTGKNSQHLAIAKILYDLQPIFRDTIDECTSLLADKINGPLLQQTESNHAVSFAIDMALYRLGQFWGIMPDLVIGYDSGQYAAACAAGSISLEDGLCQVVEELPLVSSQPAHSPLVQLEPGLNALSDIDCELLVNLGVPSAITNQIQAAWPSRSKPDIFSMLAHDHDPMQPFCHLLAQLYTAGLTINWQNWESPWARHKLKLPSYPFQRQRYWFDAVTKKVEHNNTIHPLLDRQFQSPLSNQTFFEVECSVQRSPFLQDHKVHQVVVVPAAYHLAVLLTAARLTVQDKKQILLQQVVFPQALVLAEQPSVLLQICLTQQAEGCTGKVISLAHEANYITHTTSELTFTDDALASISIAEIQARCQQKIDGAIIMQGLQAKHIDLGERFRWIEQAWLGNGEVLGQLSHPAQLEHLAMQQLHPTLIDACFQLTAVLFAADSGEIEGTWIPFKIEQLQFVEQPSLKQSQMLWCYCTLHTTTAETQNPYWNIQLLTDQGDVCCQIQQFELRQVKPETILKHRDQDWYYAINWHSQKRFGGVLSTATLANPIVISATLQPEVNQPVDYTKSLQYLETLSVGYVLEALIKLGWSFKLNQCFRIETLLAQCGVIEIYRPLLTRCITMLAEVGIVVREQDQWRLCQVVDWPATSVLFDRGLSQFPDEHAALMMLNHCGIQLAEVMQGKIDAPSVLFPEGDTEMASALYRDAPGTAMMNALLQQALMTALATLSPAQGCRILEIGAGTGGTTASLLPQLSPTATDYLFTDIGKLFLSQAQVNFQQYPFVRYAVLDIETAPIDQGLGAHQVDIVIATNVLHATKNLRQTLANVRQLLAPGGLLLLLETTTQQGWLDLIFGLLEGWWRFEDIDLRPDHPLLTTDQWQQLLLTSGFDQVEILAPSPLAALIVAQVQQPIANSPAATWIIFADPQGLAKQLSVELSNGDTDCILVYPGECYQQAVGQLTINPQHAADYQQLFADISANQTIKGVIHAWSLADMDADMMAMDSDILSGRIRHSCGTALLLLQALVGLKQWPGLWLVTQGAQAFEIQYPDLTQAPIWGLGRVIASEYPNLAYCQIDCDPALDLPQQTLSLLAEITAQMDAISYENQIILRQDQRYVGRLDQQNMNLAVAQSFKLQPQATYLITGGLGGLGLLVAGWLIEQGANHLCLIGRNPATEAVNHQLKALSRNGAQITVKQADVADGEALAVILLEIEQSAFPLRGIFHAAGRLDDGLLQQQTWTRFDEVMAAKVQGTWHLHQLTQDYGLDCFVLFSSAVTLLGTPGQSNHAAANAFLDAFAWYRQALGLPGLSIDWGAVSQIGAAAIRKADVRAQRLGIGSLEPTQVLIALDQLMNANAVQTAVLPIDWPQLLQQFPRQQYPALFAKFVQQQSAENDQRQSIQDLLAEWPNLASEERQQRLLVYLQQKFANVLLLKETDINPNQSLLELGVDSLMALEFKNALMADFALDMPLEMLIEGATTNQLVDWVSEQLSMNTLASVVEPDDDREEFML